MRSVFEISVKGLYRDEEGRILAILDSDGFWELPGGGLEAGEDIMAGLERECLEELGVEIEITDTRPFAAWSGTTPTGKQRIIITFLFKPKSFDFKITEEAQEVKMFSKQELESIKLVPQLEKLKKFI